MSELDFMSREQVENLISKKANETMQEIAWEFGGDDDHRIYMIEGMSLFLEKLQQTFGEKEATVNDNP